MAVDPNNSQIFYVGTGEPYARASRGSGIWKTTNGGASFTKLSTTTSFYYINDIAIAIWSAYSMSTQAVVEDIILRPQLGDL